MNQHIMLNQQQKNIATFIHLSTFSGYFIPFGNFILPIILWIINKDKSEFIDEHGKQAINFQISIFLYSFIIAVLIILLLLFNILSITSILELQELDDLDINISKSVALFYSVGVVVILKVIAFLFEIAFIIKASLKAQEGILYRYPLTINFIK